MKKSSVWMPLLAALVFTTIGALTGWVARGPDPHDHAAAEEAEADGAGLSPRTLANLGVRVDAVQPTSFSRPLTVLGVVVATPDTEQPVHAPIGGRVASVEVHLGTVVQPGETVVTLVRGPLPRPELTLTAGILEPAQESLHRAVVDLRRFGEEVRIARTELERVEQFTTGVEGGLPILPRQREIDLRYALARAEKDYEWARLELSKHGLDAEQLADVERGEHLPRPSEETWKRALAHNGLWPEEAARLGSALPDDLQRLPWAVATIGELVASGLASAELTEWLTAEPGASRHFLELGVLLQRGHTVADLRRLHAANAFDAIVRVTAPAPRGEGGAWDLHAVLVKPGATVADGAPLALLRDPRRLLLRTEPVGGEVAGMLGAVARGEPLAARPLVKGSGPRLEDLGVAWVEGSAENEGTVVFVRLENELWAAPRPESGARARTWALREGMRYLLEVPGERLEDVYVLPAGALTDQGPDQVVFLEDGDTFRPLPVRVLHRDERVVVLPAFGDSALFPGDRVVHSGAFALGLALNSDSGVDAHHGHSH